MPCYTRCPALYWRFTEETGWQVRKSYCGTPELHGSARREQRESTTQDAQKGPPVRLTRGALSLEGVLGLPAQALGMVIFGHGIGSGRFSPRNNFVARHLQQGRLATLLIDLLTPDEAEDRLRSSTSTCWQIGFCWPKPGSNRNTLEQVAEHALIWFQQHLHPAQYEGTGAQTKERLR